MSPGGGESWTKTEAKRKLEGCCSLAGPFPFPSTGLGATEFCLEETGSCDEGSWGKAIY